MQVLHPVQVAQVLEPESGYVPAEQILASPHVEPFRNLPLAQVSQRVFVAP